MATSRCKGFWEGDLKSVYPEKNEDSLRKKGHKGG